MAKPPIEIGIAEDGEAFRKGLKADVIEPLEDAEQAITDLGKSKGPERLERELEVAQDRTETLRKETKKTADEIDDAYRQSAAKAKSSFKESGDAAEAFGDQSKAKFSEVASSFKGDMGSIQDLAQGTLGGIAGTLTGPFALAAGGAAVGVGLIGSAIQGLVADAEATKQRVTEQFKEMAQSGIDEWSSAAATISRMTDAYADHGQDIKRISDELGLPAEVIAQAWAGVSGSIDIVNAKYAEAQQNVEKLANGNGEVANQLYLNLESSTAPLRAAIDETRQAQDQYREFAAWQDSYLRAVLDTAGTAQMEVDELGNKLFTLDDGTEILIDVDTRQATTNVTRFKGDLDDIPETVNTRLGLTLPDVDGVWRAMQRDLNSRRLTVTVEPVDRNGKPVL
ncbi:MAG TPA: hypothetical protein VNS09_06310 [Solirubrobacter sp.]|nr:hypothetical protein [Solirubrobacter sp.]